MEKDVPMNIKLEAIRISILMSQKVGFKILTIKRNKEGHNVMIKD